LSFVNAICFDIWPLAVLPSTIVLVMAWHVAHIAGSELIFLHATTFMFLLYTLWVKKNVAPEFCPYLC